MKAKKTTALLMATLVPFGVIAGTPQAFAAGSNVTSEYGQQSENMIKGTNTLTDVVKNAGKDLKKDGKLVGSGTVLDSKGKSNPDTSSSTKATSQAANAVAKSEVNKGNAGSRKRVTRSVDSSESQPEKVSITKDNFLDYFRVNGSATYDKDKGIVTITPEAMAQSGNFSLKSRINMGQSFKLIGKVNLGSKTKDGADGIGFAFHTGNTTDVGAGGGNLGIGGLRSATGFKLDTFFNAYVAPQGDCFDVNEKHFQYGWDNDPRDLGQFGAWITTSYKEVEGQDKSHKYGRWWAETDSKSAQQLDPNDLDGKFHDFTIEYNGISKKLTITYRSNAGIKTWEKTVSTPEKIMSMVVTASTGNYTNLQQFQIESFDIYQSASVDVRYVDEQDRDLAEGSVTYPNGAFKGKTYKTEQKVIPGYDFVGMKEGSLPASGTLDDWGTNGTVTYVYRQGIDQITDQAKLNKTVTRTIKYVYADGKTEGRPTLKATVTQEAKFTRTGERNRVTGKETFSAWTPANNALAKEDTPVVKGFLADKVNVAAKTVTADDKDIEETVTYKKLGSYVPQVPEGLKPQPKLPYPNDPKDPSKPGPNLPVIPHVPGVTPVAPDGTTPLTPKDPDDPSKGYNPPPIPDDPTQDTPINYVKDGQKATITFIDQTDGNKELAKVIESGKSGESIGTTNYEKRLKELTDKGYEVVKDDFKGPKNFDNDNQKDQTFTVTLSQGIDQITDQAKLNKTVTRTIKYVYADGKTEGRPTLKATVTQEAKFTRTGERNRVTGKETFSAWTPANNALAKEDTPVVKGFLADKVNVAAKTVTADDKDIEEIVTYKKLENPNPPVLNPDPTPKPPAPNPDPTPKPPAPTPDPTPKPPAPTPDPTPKPPAPTPNPVPNPPAHQPQPEKHIGMIPKTGESTTFAGLLAAIGFSIAGLAIRLKRKMMEENK